MVGETEGGKDQGSREMRLPVAEIKAMMSMEGIRESIWLEIGGSINDIHASGDLDALEKWIVSTQVVRLRQRWTLGVGWGVRGAYGGRTGAAGACMVAAPKLIRHGSYKGLAWGIGTLSRLTDNDVVVA